MLLKVSAVLASACYASSGEVDIRNVWDQARATIKSADATLSDVREHTEEAVRRESKDVEESRRHLHESADDLQKSAQAFKEAEAKLQEPIDPRGEAGAVSSFLQGDDSSFLELPASLMQFPGVSDDMKKVKAAEENFKEKMHKLHEKDDELMALAKKDFADGRKAINQIGHLRKPQPASFLEKKIMSPLDRVLEAEKKLKEVNDKLGKDFGFISL
jgi:hypothetical protein